MKQMSGVVAQAFALAILMIATGVRISSQRGSIVAVNGKAVTSSSRCEIVIGRIVRKMRGVEQADLPEYFGGNEESSAWKMRRGDQSNPGIPGIFQQVYKLGLPPVNPLSAEDGAAVESVDGGGADKRARVLFC